MAVNQPAIYNLVGDIHGRIQPKRSYDEVREDMTRYLGLEEEYDRNKFNNKFRKTDRNPTYEADELLALVYAYSKELTQGQGITANEAFQLFDDAGMEDSEYERLREFFNDTEFREATDYLINRKAQRVSGAKQNDSEPSETVRRSYLREILVVEQQDLPAYIPAAGSIETLVVEQKDQEDKSRNRLVPNLGKYLKPSQVKLSEWVSRTTEDIVKSLLEDMQSVVLVGESGIGKTATLEWMQVKLAEKARESVDAALPVLITFEEKEDRQSLANKVRNALKGLAKWYNTLFERGRLALLLDGFANLDQAARAEVGLFIESALARKNLVVVSCRTRDEADYGNILRRALIKRLDAVRIRQFIDSYAEGTPEAKEGIFWAIAGEEAERQWLRFRQDVGDDPRTFWLLDELPDGRKWGYGGEETENYYWEQWINVRNHPSNLLQLAYNPFMFLMILEAFEQSIELLNNRSNLFGVFIDYLLQEREQQTVERATELIDRLASMAFAMQHSETPSAIRIEIASKYLIDPLDLHLARNATLLAVNGEGNVSFTHSLFREYFAALKLDSAITNNQASPSEYWSPDSWWMPGKWDEVAILAAGLNTADTTPVVRWLEDSAPEVAARCIIESGSTTPDALKNDLAQKWSRRLGETPLAARVSIGRALGRLGNDPRKGVGLTKDGIPDIDWVQIPAGEFIFGDNETHYLAAYCISRYPITYLQYQAFIDAKDGYYADAWWSDVDSRDKSTGVPSFAFANHPRERANWFDAYAFCHWLESRTKSAITLPTEYQWEKAARGTDGRLYPYGNEFDAQKGNVDRTGIGKTCAVGLFPEGASPYGVLDVSGNVFEWCLNLAIAPNQIDPASREKRSLRGGSWAHSQEYARTTTRYANRPELRRNRVGFRIVCNY